MRAEWPSPSCIATSSSPPGHDQSGVRLRPRGGTLRRGFSAPRIPGDCPERRARSDNIAPPTVTDVSDRRRFEIAVDEAILGFAEYRRRPGVISFIHTEIDPAHKSEGLGTLLVKAALDTARAEGLAVLPYCPFVQGFIDRHHEYLDLVPVERRAKFALDDA